MTNGQDRIKMEKTIFGDGISNPKLKAAVQEEYDYQTHRDSDQGLGTWGALFHMIKGSLGSGILSMPLAFKYGGLWASLFGAIFIGVVATHCIHLLVHCSQVLCRRVKCPALSYAETVEAALASGPLRFRKYAVIGREIVDSALTITVYLGCVVYVVFIASSVKEVVENHWIIDFNPRYFSLMLVVVILPAGSIRHLRHLAPLSLLAIFCLLGGCGVVLYNVFSDMPPVSSRPAFTSLHELPMFYVIVLFALEGIGTILPIENAMKNPQHFLQPCGVLNGSMGLLIFLYAIIGFLGYLRYGDATKASVTLNLDSSILGEVVKLTVALNVLFSYALCICVPCEALWSRLKSTVSTEHHTMAYYSMRVLIVLSSLLLATVLPDLESFVGLAGAICYSTLGLLVPSVLEVITFWEHKEHLSLLRVTKNVFLMVMWLVAIIAGTEASVVTIINTFNRDAVKSSVISD